MHEYLPSRLQCILDEPVRKPEKFLCVLLSCIPQVDRTILKILLSFSILFTGDIENVGDPKVEQMLSFEPTDKIAEIEARKNLNRFEALKKTTRLAPTKRRVWKSIAVDIFLIVLILSRLECLNLDI